MKYNLSNIMSAAHLFRRTWGWTMSKALCSAWANEKKAMVIHAENLAEETRKQAAREESAAAYTARQAEFKVTSPEIEAVEFELFCLNCKDLWNDRDRAEASRLEARIRALRAGKVA